MKVKLGARCNGMNEPDETILEVSDDCTDEDLEEMAMDHAVTATSFDYWYERIDQ